VTQDHGHHHHPGRDADARLLLLSLAVILVFTALEIAVGIVADSLALLADAGHMLTDSVALVLAYAAYRMSERPGTSRMTYGFDRLKILVAYTNGLTVIAIALWISIEAVSRFLSPAPVLAGPMLVVATLGLAVNIVVFAILHGGDRDSLNMRGAILHVLGDLLGSVAAIAAALIILATGWLPADPVLSVLVALLLVRSAWQLIRESGLILLEASPPHVDRNDVARDIAGNIEGVADVHHMHVWTLDGRQLMATLHARLAPGVDAERTIGLIKARLDERHNIHHATVEVETGADCPDETRTRRRNGTAKW